MPKNRYCQECLKFIQGKCNGREEIDDNKRSTKWGQSAKKSRSSGLKFCSRYEFDGRLCGCIEEVETFKDIRVRGQKKAEVISDQEMADDVDFGESLSSSDFEPFDLPV